LIELLLVVLILGILGSVVVLSVAGITGKADGSGCKADSNILQTAIEAYFAQNRTQIIPPADGTPDSYENTLVMSGFLRSSSEWHDIDSSGDLLYSNNSPCEP